MTLVPLLLKTGLIAIGGLAAGAFFWLWHTFGSDVMLAYAAGLAMQCF